MCDLKENFYKKGLDFLSNSSKMVLEKRCHIFSVEGLWWNKQMGNQYSTITIFTYYIFFFADFVADFLFVTKN